MRIITEDGGESYKIFQLNKPSVLEHLALFVAFILTVRSNYKRFKGLAFPCE